MNIHNEMKIIFPAKSVNESFARAAVSSFILQLDPTVSELSDIRTAVSEAVTNCIVHAYRGEDGGIELCVKLHRDGTVFIRVKDRGCGIPDIKKAMEPLFTTAPEEERAGLGFAVMESFMDKLTVRSTVGKGTTILMRKKLEVKNEQY